MPKQNKKILIIEDEPDHLEMYRIYFEKAGYTILGYLDSAEGLKAAKIEKPDLIILDILMPNVNGWQIIKELKKDPKYKDIPILVFSNLGQLEEIKRGLDLGADDYIVKTDLTPKELLEKVERMLGWIAGGREKKKKRILIIEGDPAMANLYKMRLEGEGYEVEAAHNGLWGLRLAKIGDFDLVMLNILMSGFDGYEAIKELKEDPRINKVPILAFSHLAQEQEIKKALDLGAVSFFVKSKMTPAEVVTEVKKFIENSSRITNSNRITNNNKKNP